MRSFTLSLLAAFMACAAPASARTLDRDHAAIVSLEHRWLDHITDPRTLSTVLADDFQHPVGGGVTLSKRQQIAWARHHPAPAGRRAHFEQLNVRLHGGAAVASGIVWAQSPRGTAQRTRFTDVFVYRRGRWQAVHAQESVIRD